MLVRAGNSSASTLPVSLEPLLMTIRDEGYTLGKEICIWGLQLTNPEIARLVSAVFLKFLQTLTLRTGKQHPVFQM
jgi:hypothetical protein